MKTQATQRKPTKKDLEQEELELIQLFADHETALEAGQAAYKRADEIQDEIERRLAPGQVLDLRNGREATLEDPFLKKGQPAKAWKPSGFRRWKITIRDRRAATVTSKL